VRRSDPLCPNTYAVKKAGAGSTVANQLLKPLRQCSQLGSGLHTGCRRLAASCGHYRQGSSPGDKCPLAVCLLVVWQDVVIIPSRQLGVAWTPCDPSHKVHNSSNWIDNFAPLDGTCGAPSASKLGRRRRAHGGGQRPPTAAGWEAEVPGAHRGDGKLVAMTAWARYDERVGLAARTFAGRQQRRAIER
jgi:hypothetical protein